MRLEGTDQLQRLADALKEEGDGGLQRRVSRRLRDVTNPLGEEIPVEGAQRMPRRNGLSDRVAGSKFKTTVSFRGSVASVKIRSTGLDFKSLDAGKLRHPVFARGDQTRDQWRWVTQRVPLYQFTDAFKRKAPVIRVAVSDAVQESLDVIRKATL